MKDKKDLKIRIAVISAVVIYIIVSVVLAVVFWGGDDGLSPGVKIYGLSPAVTGYDSVSENCVTSKVSNVLNNTVFYNAPDLDIGYLTESSDYVSDSEYFSPAMVIGEGKHDKNGTIVRIYNEKQVCVAQFSAFPSSVKGGVEVAAGKTTIDGEKITLIATAACGVYCDDARSVRVYDASGMLYMKIIPEFYQDAPFAIATGHFVENDDNEYLLITSSVIKDGKVSAAIYSLSDGAVKGEFSYDLGAEHNEKSISLNVRNKADGNDSIIVFAQSPKPYKNKYFNIEEEVPPTEKDTSDMYAVFEGIPTGTLEKADLVLPYGTNGVYSSAESDERYIVTSSNEFFDDDNSYVYVYGYGDREGVLRYVDYEEKRFYWNSEKSAVEAINFSDNSYVVYSDTFEVQDSEDVENIVKNITDRAENAYWKVNLSKYGVTPVKAVYDALTAEYRNNPDGVVGIEIFSTSEILKSVTLNDSDDDVRKSFALYLLNVYGNTENVNRKFGTSFASADEIEIPVMPEYLSDDNESLFYKEWYKFTRYRAGKKITSFYAEAVSGGIPPEIVTCDAELSDYLPAESNADDYNISNKNYINDLSIVPESVMYNVGTSLGLSRSGVWYTNPRHAISLAASAGFRDISLSEYSSGTDSYETAFYQMLYLFRNGCRYVGLNDTNKDHLNTDLNALELIAERKVSRSGYADGTYGVCAVEYNGKKYNIFTLGENIGLLKSADAEGKREGSVYSVPFRTKVETTGAKVHNNPRKGINYALFNDLAAGSQIEVNFVANCGKSDDSYVKISVYHDGFLIEDACETYKLSENDRYYRYVFKNGLELGQVKVEIECVCENYTEFELKEIDVILQRENNVYPAADDYTGGTATGSVYTDILDRDAVYRE